MSNAISVEEISKNVVVRFDRPEVRSPLSVDVLDQLPRLVGQAKALEMFFTARRVGAH